MGQTLGNDAGTTLRETGVAHAMSCSVEVSVQENYPDRLGRLTSGEASPLSACASAALPGFASESPAGSRRLFDLCSSTERVEAPAPAG